MRIRSPIDRAPNGMWQAFIVFDSISSASTAITSMQGFPLYDKQLVTCHEALTNEALANVLARPVQVSSSLPHEHVAGRG